MTICGSDMKRSAVIILMFNTMCALSQNVHEVTYFVGCFVNGTAEVQFEFDDEEILYVDLKQKEIVYTIPIFHIPDPSQLFEGLNVLNDALTNSKICLGLTQLGAALEKNLPDNTEPPESILFPSEEVQLGVENSLICFMNNFFPPHTEVSWTKNGFPVSEGVSHSQYNPNKDGTFHQFSTLTFIPSEEDIYSCTVEHAALERPKTRIWEAEFNHQSLGPDIYCGVGLTLGLLGIATGVSFIVKGQHEQ